MTQLIKDKDYKQWLSSLKERFQQAQIKAAVKVNSTLIEFYWELGADIVERQKNTTWGSGFLKQVSKDLSLEFPSIKGFSVRNLEIIRQWFLFYNNENEITKQLVSQLNKNTDDPILEITCSQIKGDDDDAKGQQLVSQFDANLLFQIPWGQNIVIISKSKTIEEAIFYVQQTIENGWSRAVLVHQMESKLYKRQGKAITNFEAKLPKTQSDLAQQLIKDPYNFEFLTLTKDFKEQELERGLVQHITQFLLELGAGFAYIGQQVELKVGERNFYIDLLFYHTKLRCYVVVELKAVEFEPEFAGKLNFYLNAVDGELKHQLDAPSIGILLCKTKDNTVVEYALKNVDTPIGISEYEITESLPENLKSALPSVEDIEAELEKLNDENKKEGEV